MGLDPKTLSRRLADLRADLGRAGVRVTPQRLEIFKEVARSGEHPDAETVFRGVRRRIPGISLDTVYRTLWLLLESGAIAALGPSRDRLRFDGNTASHHHFTCRVCDRVQDFLSPEFDSLEVPGEVRTMGRVEKIQVEFSGLCGACRLRRVPMMDRKPIKRRSEHG